MQDFNFVETETEIPNAEAEEIVQDPDNFNKGFDFERLAVEWFQQVDDRRENASTNNDVDEEDNDNQRQ